jgi:hypothetical protein
MLQPDGSFASLSAWMIEPAASRFEIGDEPHYPGERLVVCRNPLLAEERARKRGELLDATVHRKTSTMPRLGYLPLKIADKRRIALRIDFGRRPGAFSWGEGLGGPLAHAAAFRRFLASMARANLSHFAIPARFQDLHEAQVVLLRLLGVAPRPARPPNPAPHRTDPPISVLTPSRSPGHLPPVTREPL